VTTPYEHHTIGPLLARLRQARGYSQLNLAQLLCAATGHPTITRHEISRWERQERIPSRYWLTPLAEVLGVPVDVLQTAAAAARRSDPPEPRSAGPAVASWLTFHHGPREFVIALGGVEVDQIRTVLAPVRPHPSTEAAE
jgi:transcriptional regulator with XRE-family HTH domain